MIFIVSVNELTWDLQRDELLHNAESLEGLYFKSYVIH